MLNCYFSFETLYEKNPSGISTSKFMMGDCFSHQLVRERVPSSDWLARLSLRIKRVLNIALIQFLTSEFHNLFVRLITILSLQISSLLCFGSLEPNTGDISLTRNEPSRHPMNVGNFLLEPPPTYQVKIIIIINHSQLNVLKWLTIYSENGF